MVFFFVCFFALRFKSSFTAAGLFLNNNFSASWKFKLFDELSQYQYFQPVILSKSILSLENPVKTPCLLLLFITKIFYSVLQSKGVNSHLFNGHIDTLVSYSKKNWSAKKGNKHCVWLQFISFALYPIFKSHHAVFNLIVTS